MRTVKLSDFPDFQGKELLLRAQEIGLEIAKPMNVTDAQSVMLIGLANMLSTGEPISLAPARDQEAA